MVVGLIGREGDQGRNPFSEVERRLRKTQASGVAEDAIAVEAARLLTYSAAAKMARGESAVKEVSMAKVFAVDTLFKTAFNGMQAMGGYSQLPEMDMERYMREAKHGMVGGGANKIQKSIIAKLMGL
jgi:alkylation response protein AidB-like acyl-CoA dehydrogenase